MQFISGYALASPPLLGRFLPPLAEGIAAHYLQHCSQQGDLVFDPFGQSAQVALEALRLERRVLVASFNPVSRLTLSLAVRPSTEPELRTALTRLADAPKDGGRLEPYLKSLYRTTCAACGAEVSADAIEWVDGEPAFKSYTCLRCQHTVQDEPASEADQALARRFSARGLDYHFLLDRVASTADPERAHAEEALAVYPPRTLTAIASTLTRFDTLPHDRELRRRLAGLMVAALDATCVLAQERPRALTALPKHYVEKNFWLALERATGQIAGALTPENAAPLEDLVSGRAASGIHLSAESARELTAHVPPGACKLVIAAIPRPNQAYWTLSAVWASWLWGHAAAAALHGILRRRRYDWDWHTETLARIFTSALPALEPEGSLAGLMPEAEPGFTSAALAAASRAGYALTGATLRADTAEAQFLWKKEKEEEGGRKEEEGRRKEEETAALEIARMGAEATLLARGEPARWHTVHFGAWRALAELRQLRVLHDEAVSVINHRLEPVFRNARFFRRLEAGPKDELTTGLWFLPEATRLDTQPLGDRVEEAVRGCLLGGETLEEPTIVQAVCADFPGADTPDQNLVLACLHSYAHEVEPGVWQLRPEDAVAVRAQELDSIQAQLRTLASRLGFEAADTNPQAWKDEGETVYLFTVMTSAALSAHVLGPLLNARRRFLVLPGGRAGLAAYKLRRDPRLKAALDRDNWVLLKFRAIRGMVDDLQLTRVMLEPAFYADPLEEEARQLALGT